MKIKKEKILKEIIKWLVCYEVDTNNHELQMGNEVRNYREYIAKQIFNIFDEGGVVKCDKCQDYHARNKQCIEEEKKAKPSAKNEPTELEKIIKWCFSHKAGTWDKHKVADAKQQIIDLACKKVDEELYIWDGISTTTCRRHLEQAIKEM